MTAAEELRDCSGPEAAAVYGSLVLVGGVAAARRRDPWTARDRIRSVTPVAWKGGAQHTLDGVRSRERRDARRQRRGRGRRDQPGMPFGRGTRLRAVAVHRATRRLPSGTGALAPAAW